MIWYTMQTLRSDDAMMWWLVLGKAEDIIITNTWSWAGCPEPVIPYYSSVFWAFWALLHRKNPKWKVKPKHTPKPNQHQHLSLSLSLTYTYTYTYTGVIVITTSKVKTWSFIQISVIGSWLILFMKPTHAESEADTKTSTFAYST